VTARNDVSVFREAMLAYAKSPSRFSGAANRLQAVFPTASLTCWSICEGIMAQVKAIGPVHRCHTFFAVVNDDLFRQSQVPFRRIHRCARLPAIRKYMAAFAQVQGAKFLNDAMLLRP
jgi:hypothetical protein